MPDRREDLLASLARNQDGVLSRAQLRSCSYDRHAVRAQVEARRWQLLGPSVVLLHSGPATGRQRLWHSLLAEGEQTVALAGRTAAAMHGLTGYESSSLHVVVPHGARVHRVQGVRVHVSRRFCAADLHPTRQPNVVRVDRALVDAAVWSRSPRTACALLAAAVQQRLTTPARLRLELLAAGQVRHRKLLLAVLADIEGGAQSLAEIDFGRLCRRYRLPPPARQQVRTDRQGRRRYLDVAWVLPDGRTVVLEIDGAVHLLVATYWDDMDRALDLALGGCDVVRLPTVALRLEPARVAERLLLLLHPRPGRQIAV